MEPRTTYPEAQLSTPKDALPLCDLVMKGGVSSRVIYPFDGL